nr:hypothetical protein [uncultured Caproiciproducens sp.]
MFERWSNTELIVTTWPCRSFIVTEPRSDSENLHGAQNKDYAKAVLHLLHQAMVQCFGTDFLTEGVTDYVMVPGVVQSKEKGNLCIALLELDLTSSGEHYDPIS